MKIKRKKKKTLVLAVKHGLAYIAIWQFLGFLILLLLVWVNEFIDFASFFYGAPPQEPNIARACLASAAIIFAAIIVVGHTYTQQHKIISGMLTICTYCHRIEIDEKVWEYIRKQIEKNQSLNISHGICANCLEKVKQDWDNEKLPPAE